LRARIKSTVAAYVRATFAIAATIVSVSSAVEWCE
jgi:hypothetical protein